MNIAVIIGVRPHYVKAQGLMQLFSGLPYNFIFVDVHQHYDNLLRGAHCFDTSNYRVLSSLSACDNVIDEFTRQVNEIGHWFQSEEGRTIKAVIVLGDANPAFSGAIAANRLNIPVIHIEAGVRRIENEKEHWNTIVADHLSSLRYCYTPKSYENLVEEGLATNSFYVGDILASWTIQKLNDAPTLPNNECPFILVSIHRPQNCNIDAITNLCDALKTLRKKVVWILHPRTKDYESIIKEVSHIRVIPPQDHLSTLQLIKGAEYIVTDSGGLIREGVLASKRVVVCHKQGMWEELVRDKRIIRTDMLMDSIIAAINEVKTIDCESGKKYFLVENGIETFIVSLRDFLKELDNE